MDNTGTETTSSGILNNPIVSIKKNEKTYSRFDGSYTTLNSQTTL